MSARKPSVDGSASDPGRVTRRYHVASTDDSLLLALDDRFRNAIEQAAASNETDRAALTEKRASLAKEITRAERAIERYQDAFENGDLLHLKGQFGTRKWYPQPF